MRAAASPSGSPAARARLRRGSPSALSRAVCSATSATAPVVAARAVTQRGWVPTGNGSRTQPPVRAASDTTAGLTSTSTRVAPGSSSSVHRAGSAAASVPA